MNKRYTLVRQRRMFKYAAIFRLEMAFCVYILSIPYMKIKVVFSRALFYRYQFKSVTGNIPYCDHIDLKQMSFQLRDIVGRFVFVESMWPL